MKNTRKGNDINVAWKILKNGNPFSLMGKDITIYLKSPFGKEKIKDFSVTGNIINWTFFGKDQKHSGEYSLELVINENEVGMITTDKCGFVNLVPCSCMEGGSDEGNIETESIELTTTLEYVAGEGGGSYDDSALWIEVTRLENEKADKTEIPTKLSQLEQDIEIGGESYDDTKVWEAIDELDRTKADSVDVANTLLSYPTKTEIADGYQPKGNYATESQVTELSAEIGRVSERVDELGEGGSSVFEVVYGETTYEEIVEANNEGKIVVARHENMIYRLSVVKSYVAILYASEGSNSYTLKCSNKSVWSGAAITNTHSLKTLDNGNTEITIAGKSAEVATPQYVENLLGVIINGEY